MRLCCRVRCGKAMGKQEAAAMRLQSPLAALSAAPLLEQPSDRKPSPAPRQPRGGPPRGSPGLARRSRAPSPSYSEGRRSRRRPQSPLAGLWSGGCSGALSTNPCATPAPSRAIRSGHRPAGRCRIPLLSARGGPCGQAPPGRLADRGHPLEFRRVAARAPGGRMRLRPSLQNRPRAILALFSELRIGFFAKNIQKKLNFR
jgi:hypothetical protein